MDTRRFDCLTKSLTTTGRRGAPKAIVGAALAAVGVAAVTSDALTECAPNGLECRGSTAQQRNHSCCSECCRDRVCRRRKACN